MQARRRLTGSAFQNPRNWFLRIIFHQIDCCMRNHQKAVQSVQLVGEAGCSLNYSTPRAMYRYPREFHKSYWHPLEVDHVENITTMVE